MKKAALFFMLVIMSGSVLTGCSINSATEEKAAASAAPKLKNPRETETPKETEVSGKVSVNKNKTEEMVESGEITQGWNSMVLYDIDMNEVQVTRGDDGNWYDADGVSYGDLENADETQPIINDNGNAYYWNGYYAEQAAGKQESGEENSDTEINDPYDLYSWDEGTESYIPFQEAESDGSPIGRGNGWYYHDEESGEFLPW